jgi:membrane-associated phospholipid phosphatase
MIVPGSEPDWHACRGALAFAGLGLVIALAADGWLGDLDRAVIRLLGNGRSPAAVRVARSVSTLAEPATAAVPLAVAAVIAWRRGGWRAACGPCLAVASGSAIRRLLSRAVARQRPPETLWLAEPEGFSLPSKHTALAALTAGACARGMGCRGPARHGAPLLAAAGVGASRVYLGVHWPTDVVAAWLFAEVWLSLCMLGPARDEARVTSGDS